MREGPIERPWLVRSRLFILERPSEGGQEVLAQTAATPAKTLTVFLLGFLKCSNAPVHTKHGTPYSGPGAQVMCCLAPVFSTQSSCRGGHGTELDEERYDDHELNVSD